MRLGPAYADGPRCELTDPAIFRLTSQSRGCPLKYEAII